MKNKPSPRNTRKNVKNVKNAHYVTHVRMTENTRLRFQAVAHRLEEKEGSPMSDSLVFEKLLEMRL
jgi:hypothetical protein